MFFGPIFDARDYLAAQLRRIGDSVKSMADELEERLALPVKEVPQIEAEPTTNGRSRKRIEA
jgi:uncharacterized small protein (DUF1192 family)